MGAVDRKAIERELRAKIEQEMRAKLLPRVASNAEVREALVERLAAFGVRVAREEGGGTADPPHGGKSGD